MFTIYKMEGEWFMDHATENPELTPEGGQDIVPHVDQPSRFKGLEHNPRFNGICSEVKK